MQRPQLGVTLSGASKLANLIGCPLDKFYIMRRPFSFTIIGAPSCVLQYVVPKNLLYTMHTIFQHYVTPGIFFNRMRRTQIRYSMRHLLMQCEAQKRVLQLYAALPNNFFFMRPHNVFLEKNAPC